MPEATDLQINGYSRTSPENGDADIARQLVRQDYKFDAATFEIELMVRDEIAGHNLIFGHRVRRPTLEELLEREANITYEILEVDARQDVVQFDVEWANAKLWDKVIKEVQGYDFKDGTPPQEWHTLSEDQKGRMFTAHKNKVVNGMYDDESVPLLDEGLSFESMRIQQTFRQLPDAVVVHELRMPQESERRAFRQKATQTRYLRGAKKSRATVTSNLRAFITLYDALLLNIEGASIDGQPFTTATRQQFLHAIDPMFKRSVIQSMMNTFEAQLLDT